MVLALLFHPVCDGLTVKFSDHLFGGVLIEGCFALDGSITAAFTGRHRLAFTALRPSAYFCTVPDTTICSG